LKVTVKSITCEVKGNFNVSVKGPGMITLNVQLLSIEKGTFKNNYQGKTDEGGAALQITETPLRKTTNRMVTISDTLF
jgi:hypothetical protein